MRARKVVIKCSNYLASLAGSSYHFHNIEHTRYVVKKISLLLKKNKTISPSDYQLGIIAAWAHDLGYTQGRHNHEARSVEIISTWMMDSSFEIAEIRKVQEAIMATKIPQQAKSAISKALCDADMAHLASPNYAYWANKLEAEWVATNLFSDDKKQLLDIQINFIRDHRYLTLYAGNKWKNRKLKTLDHLMELRKQKQ